MANRFGKLKVLTMKSSDREFDKAFDDYVVNDIEAAYDRAKMLYQLKEQRKQNRHNRYLVLGTWLMALATCLLVLVSYFGMCK